MTAIMPDNLNRKRTGRPKGSKNGTRRSPRWKPVEWRPEYEQIVALSCTGASNKFLAEKFSFTPVQISNILNCEQAKVIKELVIEKTRQKLINRMETDMEIVSARAMDNIKRVLNSDELLEKSPFKMLDSSVKFLQGTGKLKGESGDKVQNNVYIDQRVANLLFEGANKALEVQKLHAQKLLKEGEIAK